MSKITEEDILSLYMPLVIQECKNSYKGIEWEERIAEGGIALLYAIRTYRAYYGCFKEYMITQLRRIMKQKNKEAWKVKRLESRISLDAPFIVGEDNLVFAECIAAPLSDDVSLVIQDFIVRLSPIEQNVVCMLMDNYSIQEISSKTSMTLHQITSLLDDLRNKLSAYYGESFCVC